MCENAVRWNWWETDKQKSQLPITVHKQDHQMIYRWAGNREGSCYRGCLSQRTKIFGYRWLMRVGVLLFSKRSPLWLSVCLLNPCSQLVRNGCGRREAGVGERRRRQNVERTKCTARSHARLNHSGDSHLLGLEKCKVKRFLPKKAMSIQ